MKVLIIDDTEMDIKGIMHFCEEQKWEKKWETFEKNYYKTIIEWNPDVVILDWYNDADDDNEEGNRILESIWKNGYRPIVVFSAHADAIDLQEKEQKSSLLKVIKKGDDSDVTDYLYNNVNYFTALNQFRDRLGDVIIESFNAIEPIKRTSKTYIGDEVVKYMLAKRTINAFDLECIGIDLPAWGMYIVPPISSSLSTCDLIREVSNGKDYQTKGVADEYFLVMTPSCDLVSNESRKPKVKNVICVPCRDKRMFYNEEEQCISENCESDNPEERKRLSDESIIHALNQGYSGRWLPLPEMIDVCPYMSANLKAIKMIALKKIALSVDEINSKSEYVRVASIDVAYVNQIVWAFMQNICRPGVPDRNVEEWAKDILD